MNKLTPKINFKMFTEAMAMKFQVLMTQSSLQFSSCYSVRCLLFIVFVFEQLASTTIADLPYYYHACYHRYSIRYEHHN